MRWMLLVVAVLGAWWWLGDDDASVVERADLAGTTREQQAAVLRDGFAVRDGARVRLIDRKGEARAEHTLGKDGDLRVVGTKSGPAAVWLDGKNIRLVDVKNGKTVGVWGKAARTLCEGAATNDERFAVGWLEDDGTLWFVHGDTRPATETTADDVRASGVVANADRRWCGVASAGDKIALFWREGKRLFIDMCTRKKCSGVPAVVGLEENATLLGFTCQKKGCLLATRDPRGNGRVGYVTEAGSTKWSKVLAKSARDFSIVGVGDRAFALAFGSDEEAEVMRVEAGGAMTRLWHGERAPVLAWSRGLLLLGFGNSHTLVEVAQ